MSDQMKRGKRQVMYSFPPGATFSNPKHNLIERSKYMYGDELPVTSEQEIIESVHAWLENWDGGVRGNIPAPVSDLWAIIDPQNVYSGVFPRVFRCMDCEKVHDYSDNRFDNLARKEKGCQNPDCNGTLTQIHHVGVCPACSDISSVDVPGCDEHGYEHIVLDGSSDMYREFKWRCNAKHHNNVVVSDNFHTFCDCGEMMQMTVHSASKTQIIHDMTRVDLAGTNVYRRDLYDEEDIDPLVIGAYLGEFNHPETSLEELIKKDEVSDIDYGELDTDDPEQIKAVKQALGQIGGEDDPQLVRQSVTQKLDNISPSENMRRYIQLQEIMEYDSVRERATNKEEQIMNQMGIHDIGITSEFPLLKFIHSYHRTYEDQEDGDPEPSARLFPQVEVEDGTYKQPIYTTKSETEAIIVQLDPRDVGHWLAMSGYDIEDTANMSLADARATVYDEMSGVPPYETNIVDNDDYNPITTEVHGLLHSISHLLLQRAAVHSGIEETSFAEYLFTEGLATAIYSNNTQNYTAGGLFTLAERNLADWLQSTRREGERCVYDPTCANIRDGACHACLHISEVGCQHFNKNLSRVSTYGERIADTPVEGYWTTTGAFSGK